ncbi:MAG: hypothetical protein HQ558_03510 [Candidatus Omnitrophica bacterium]|nr:hypothetical protein [Candidatus Omnitrophota bacterium]
MIRLIFCCILLCVFSAGCAGIEPPSAERVFTPWRNATPLQLGESKGSVMDKWGAPDNIVQLGPDELGLQQEEWVYQNALEVPVGHEYVGRTKRLIFTGNVLTGHRGGLKPEPSDKQADKDENIK